MYNLMLILLDIGYAFSILFAKSWFCACLLHVQGLVGKERYLEDFRILACYVKISALRFTQPRCAAAVSSSTRVLFSRIIHETTGTAVRSTYYFCSFAYRCFCNVGVRECYFAQRDKSVRRSPLARRTSPFCN